MTKLSKSRAPLVRETDTLERTQAIVIELCPRYLAMRLKYGKEAYSVPYDVLLDWLRKRDYKRKAS
jgi:hypothetical protein